MTYDLEVWSVDPIMFPGALPDSVKWEGEGPMWAYDAGDWDICAHMQKAQQEDAPDEIADHLPENIYLISITLQGNAPDHAVTLADETARQIARSSRGIFINPQDGFFEDHEGHKLDVPPVRHETFSLLEFNWWFEDTPLKSASGLREFLRVLGTTLPEALPRRYGSHPPQYEFNPSESDHFIDFALNEFSDGIGLMTWRTSRPVMSASMSISSRYSGPGKMGYRANALNIGVDAQVLAAGWQHRLEIFWREISMLVQPFYGDIRTLKNFIRGRTEIIIGSNTEEHPVKHIWWKGIPHSLGHAVVLGGPYPSLWPKFSRAASHSGDLALLLTPDWQSGRDLSKQIGGAPLTLRQGAPPNGYALRWPFDGPYAAKAKQ